MSLKKTDETTHEYFVYILECSDKSLYCGMTNDLKKRLKAHNNKTASKYTRGRTPVKLMYYESGFTKGEALSREAQIKKLTKQKKLNLIKNFKL